MARADYRKSRQPAEGWRGNLLQRVDWPARRPHEVSDFNTTSGLLLEDFADLL
jgi:hypothetical protein